MPMSLSMRKAMFKQSLTSYHAWKLPVFRTVCSWRKCRLASAQNLYHLTAALAEKGIGLAEREVAPKPKVLLPCSNVNQVCEPSTTVSITLCIEGRLTPNTS